MQKQKDHAFSSDIYLLGKSGDGVKYWLEAPRWDCGWYWGFGYIETYTNNSCPSKSRDISSHSHADNFMREYFTEWNGSKPILADRTFSEAEGWELSELFAQFYELRDQAEFWGRGKMNVANAQVSSWKDVVLADRINTKMIPEITARILAILTPQKGGTK